MEAKTTRGYRLSLQTVWLQSPVSNLNLLCHLKSPWTNLTLACNNRLEECLSVVCVCVCVLCESKSLPALIMGLEDYDTLTHTHTESHKHRRLIKTTCGTAVGALTQTHEHSDKTFGDFIYSKCSRIQFILPRWRCCKPLAQGGFGIL